MVVAVDRTMFSAPRLLRARSIGGVVNSIGSKVKMSSTPGVPNVEQYEKLASFYLGRRYDLAEQRPLDELLMYDAKDLCTHAMCVGMTGSGKTGLCLSLLEEAAIDGIPVICVDPKGDLANLMLAFPELRPEDFKPWLEPGEATRKGVSLDELAESTAATWKKGLASWGQSPDRIRRFRDSVDIAIYTPGSNAGLPLTVLKSFDSPPPEVLADTDAMRERVMGAASGLLTLMGINADPLLSREHILISSLLDHGWREGKHLSLADLIGLIQRPPMQRIGVMDLETFMPIAERAKMSMQLNNLLASPAFASWLEGEALSIERLLHTPEGKPRVSILSIAHLNDTERMFFLTILLNELLAWVRTQSGTGSLRALFYMDEIAGYFPPVSNPPSKPPMLTLLKQARAFGLGITLATQNPVDLDYKGLSNIGTWFIGRLQTERDKARVLDGLEGASVQNGAAFDRKSMELMLSALGQRVFLMNNVHEDSPVVFQTRWALSFLAGPLARAQITRLMADRKRVGAVGAPMAGGVVPPATVQSERPIAIDFRQDPLPSPAVPAVGASKRPVIPAAVTERFLEPSGRLLAGFRLVYRPAILGAGSLHYVRAAGDVDRWVDYHCLLDCSRGLPKSGWEEAGEVDGWALDQSPRDGFAFAEVATELLSAATYKGLDSQFKEYLYRHHSMTIYKAPALGKFAPAGMSEGEARVHFTQDLRELRDRETEKIRAKYASKAQSLEKAIRTAGERVERERSSLRSVAAAPMIELGTSILNTFFGRKTSRSASSRTASVLRGANTAYKKKADADRAEETLRQLQIDLEDLETSLRREIDEMTTQFDVTRVELEPVVISPRKSDLKTRPLVFLWVPWQVDPQGIAEPMFG